VTDLEKATLERDQAVAALRMIIDAGTDLFKLIDAIHAVRTLLTKL
jgi:hypothetical protein